MNPEKGANVSNNPLLEEIPTSDEIELRRGKRWRRLLSIGVAFPLLGVAAYLIWSLSSDWGTTAQEYVRRAVAYEEKGRLYAARIELQNALSADPKNGTIVLQLAHLLERLGYGHAAIKQFDKARDLGAEIDDTHLPWLRALVDTGEHRSVVKRVLASPAVRDSLPHLLLVGNAYLAKGQERSATLAFERALRIDGNSALAHVGLGRIALAADDRKEANRRSLIAVGISQPPVEAWVFRGDVVLAGGELTTALRAFENAVEIDPSNDLAQIGRARVLVATKEHEKANKALWGIERRNPRLTAVRYLLALNAFGQDDLEAAQEAARTVVRSEPTHAPSLMLLGVIAKRANNPREAEEYLRRCVAAAPGMIAPRKVLAELLMELEDWDTAIEVLTGALKVEEKDPDVYTMIAAAHAKTGRYALATRFFESAVSAAPDSAAARMNLGVMLLAAGEPGKAAV
ncbi:MAG: putative PEP-CTERM system TPR-repeat lipoprotein, partial [Gammaproteobacteria bacterium]